MRYIGRKYQLDGNTDVEKDRIAMLEQQVSDINMQFALIAYNPDCETLKVEFLKNLPDSLKLVADFLADNPFAAGANISYVDFMLYEYLLKISLLATEQFQQFPTLQKFLERIQSLPRVKEYIKAATPKMFHAPFAKWNTTH